MKCIFCKSYKKITKEGYRYNKSGKKQKYHCHNCNRLFVQDDGFWKMKHKPEIIAEAISCRKRGMPYIEVSKHFREYNKADICAATVYNWVVKYGNVLRKFNLQQKPKLGRRIHNDEFVFNVKGKKM